jgi:hypothetical protein
MQTDSPFEPVSTPGRKPYRFPPGLYHLCVQKADLSHLEVRAEAEALSIELAAASPSPRGWLPCRAVGRVARNPWAALSVGSAGLRGLSRDLGGLEGRAPSLFDLAVTTGRFPDRESAVRHYAERTGVGIPPAGNGGPHGARSLADRVAWLPARPSAPADLEAWCRRKSGILPAALRAFGARKCRGPRNPATGSFCWCLVGRREDSNAPVALVLSVVARNPSRKMRAVSSWLVVARCLESARNCR